jgi:hypothetical protein
MDSNQRPIRPAEPGRSESRCLLCIQTPKKTRQRRKPGPAPERVKINMPWEQAVDYALCKKQPKDGWPRPEGKG